MTEQFFLGYVLLPAVSVIFASLVGILAYDGFFLVRQIWQERNDRP